MRRSNGIDGWEMYQQAHEEFGAQVYKPDNVPDNTGRQVKRLSRGIGISQPFGEL